MKQFFSILAVLIAICTYQLTVQAQTAGSIAGTVVDQTGAVVPNATVVVKGQAGQEFTVTTRDNGTYNIPVVASGLYTVTTTATGFKTSVRTNVKVDVGTPAAVDVALETGDVSAQVVITSGAEVLQTQTATVGTNIQGRQIIETPIQSRNALDLVTLLPGTNTIGTVRTSSVNGLPKGALSITVDGVDVQDNYLRSSDGFFTFVTPRVDAIEEVTVSTAVPGAESSGDGAVQVKFATRRGTNQYNGSTFWQHRDEGLNTNNFLNNRGGLAKQKLRLNQFGGRLGGPLPFFRFGEGGKWFDSGKDRSFFFVNYERYHLNEFSPARARTILDTEAQTGLYEYIAPTPAGGLSTGCTSISATQMRCQRNVLNIAGTAGFVGTSDPTVAALLATIRNSTAGTGAITPISGDINRQLYTFYNSGQQRRGYLALRFDFNLTKNHSLENVYNNNRFRSNVDFLNSVDPAFPGLNNAGTQNSDRWSNSTALRSTFGQSVVNELRFARLGGESRFDLVGGTQFFTNNQAGFSLGLSAAGITNATIRNAFTARSSPTYDLTDNVNWILGTHTVSLGGQYKIIKTITNNTNTVVPSVVFTANTAGLDPIFASVFNTTNFPNATAAQLAEANNLYNVLAGRVTGLTTTAYLTADGTYVAQGAQGQEIKQRTYGLFAQDTWRIKPNLTLNYGIRWQPQDSPIVETANFAALTNFNQVYDVSGVNNLFSPGTLTGTVPTATGLAPGSSLSSNDRNNFAPSVGIVYSPDFKDGIVGKLFGGSGRSVLRAGFSRAFVREGTLLTSGGLGLNPGSSLSASRAFSLGNVIAGTYLRNGSGNPNLTPASFPLTPSYPRTLTTADAAVGIIPNLKTGYVDSFTVGYQRELDRNTVVEFRYVGNRGKDMQSLYLINETNAIENGFGAEFKLAQQNLLLNQAAGRGNTFAYFGGTTGTNQLPIFVSYLTGSASPSLTTSYGSLFSNATLVNALATSNPNVQGLASTLEGNFRATGLAAGRPSNFFNNCPTTLGFCFIIDNSEKSWYDAGVIELRRRLSAGLRFQASYTYGKSYTNRYASPSGLSSSAATTDQYNNSSVTLRNPDLDRSLSQVDIRHAFKFDATYDLPFGKGQRFLSNSNGLVDKVIGGFSIVPVVRWQSGSPMLLENVQLVGMTVEDLQKQIKAYRNVTYTIGGATGTTYNGPTWLPADIIQNTIAAFNTSATTGTGYTAQFGTPTGRFIAPAGYNNCQARFAGECGFRKLVLYGPSFFKFDATVIKRIKFDEKRNVELRVTAFDVLNRTNFRITGWTGNVGYLSGFGGTTFGQLGAGTTYQDPSGSNDPGGRLIDLMLRINF